MEKWEIRPPLPQKLLNRSSLSFAWVIMWWTPTPVCRECQQVYTFITTELNNSTLLYLQLQSSLATSWVCSYIFSKMTYIVLNWTLNPTAIDKLTYEQKHTTK